MTISLKNAERAAAMVGLNEPGAIRKEHLDAKIAQAGRLALFMDQLDQPVPSDLLPNHLQSRSQIKPTKI